MSSLRKHTRLLLVAVVCVALGAGASAIATAGAASSSSAKTGAAGGRAKLARIGGLRRFAARAVHGDVVVRTKSGFATVTFDRGTVDSVSGQQLAIAEGTKKASYKTVTVTIPAGAVVRDDRHKASLSDVKAGQRVLVLVAPKRTFVMARTPKTA
jgi:hypothetical protein